MTVTIELPAVVMDREMLESVRSGATVLLSLLSFWLMAAARTSHHTEFHYSFYPSLTFFEWVGVLSFLYSGGLAADRFLRVLAEDVRRPLETYGPFVMLWLSYTAAVAASATSTDLHATFDEADGSVCKARQSRARGVAGAYFCGHVVGAIVFMYGLAAAYAATILLNASSGGGYVPDAAGGGSGAGGFAGSTGYNEIDAADVEKAPASHQNGPAPRASHAI